MLDLSLGLFYVRSMPNRFGLRSTHTDEKLNKLEKYLDRFTTVLKFQPFDLIYFDAFAGTPEIDVGTEDAPLLEADDLKPFIDGSSARALRFGKKFSRYIFVDSKKANVRELEALKRNHPELMDRIETHYSDANDGVLDEWMPLGSNGRHSYSLIFACANPDRKANQLAGSGSV